MKNNDIYIDSYLSYFFFKLYMQYFLVNYSFSPYLKVLLASDEGPLKLGCGVGNFHLGPNGNSDFSVEMSLRGEGSHEVFMIPSN